jgi:hypothetical protein
MNDITSLPGSLANLSGMDQLNAALNNAGVSVEQLLPSGTGPLTMFLPVGSAWANAPSIVKTQSGLRDFLLYSTVKGSYPVSAITPPGMMVPTLLPGQSVYLTRDAATGNIAVNGIPVVSPADTKDVKNPNLVVQGINGFLVPPVQNYATAGTVGAASAGMMAAPYAAPTKNDWSSLLNNFMHSLGVRGLVRQGPEVLAATPLTTPIIITQPAQNSTSGWTVFLWIVIILLIIGAIWYFYKKSKAGQAGSTSTGAASYF